MPRIIRFNNTSNLNASEVARRAQARAIYADALVNQKNLDKDCLNAVSAGPSAAASYSANKVTDQRLGAIFTTPAQQAEIIASSSCEVPPIPVIVYPNYELSCSDPLGIQIMATGSFTRFTFTTTSLGAGCLEFQYFLNGNYVSNDFVVLGVTSNLITPPNGIDEVRYVFKCSPIVVTIDCSGTPTALQYTNPYSFYNPSLFSVTLTLTKYPAELGTITQVVSGGELFTPTPSWGWYLWSIACVGSLSFPGTFDNKLYIDPSPSLVLGSGDFTVEWYQYYDDNVSQDFPTVFAYGTYNDNLEVEVYIDNQNNQMWFYVPNSSEDSYVVNIPDPYRNVWCHFAICRSSGNIYIYQNGYLLTSGAMTYNFSDTSLPLTIGNEEYASSGIAFQGKITNFRLTIGNALYPNGTTFTPPPIPLPSVSGTQLLLNVSSSDTFLVDSSPAGRTVTETEVTYSSNNPFS